MTEQEVDDWLRGMGQRMDDHWNQQNPPRDYRWIVSLIALLSIVGVVALVYALSGH